VRPSTTFQSFEPETMMFGFAGSTASGVSFCDVVSRVTFTGVLMLVAAAGPTPTASSSAAANKTMVPFKALSSPLLSPAWPQSRGSDIWLDAGAIAVVADDQVSEPAVPRWPSSDALDP
jgi:hypothetical protein